MMNVHGMPIVVEVNGDLERAFKDLKKRLVSEGVYKELKRRRFYEKPSEIRKKKRIEAIRKRLKKLKKYQFGR
jgi:small subunit ribosomal protein S21